MGRILCIDKSKIKKANYIQKDIELEDLMSNHCKYFSRKELVDNSNYTPLDIGFSVRTTYTNKVLEVPLEGGIKRYYSILTNTPVLPYGGTEILMYMTSLGVVRSAKAYDEDFSNVMMYSKFQPIGLLNTDYVENPIIYTHVILKDGTEEDFTKCLKEGYRLIDIKDMVTSDNLKVLCDELIEIKEEEE